MVRDARSKSELIARITVTLFWGMAVFVVLLVGGLILRAHAETPVPVQNGYVTDLAGVFSPDDLGRLRKGLSEFERSRSDKPQMYVLTLKATPEEGLEPFTTRVFNAWGVGSREHNNGLLWVWIPSERRMRTEVGSGIEGAITDTEASRANTQTAGPLLKANKPVDAILALKDRFTKDLDPVAKNRESQAVLFLPLLVLGFCGGLTGVTFILGRRARKRRIAEAARRAREAMERREARESRSYGSKMDSEYTRQLPSGLARTRPTSPAPIRTKEPEKRRSSSDDYASGLGAGIGSSWGSSSSGSSSGSSSYDSGSSYSSSGDGGSSSGGGSSDSY